MITKQLIKNSSLFIFLLLMFALSSCYKNVAGCLDIYSKNFNAGADVECGDCCTYPEIQVSVSFEADTFGYSFSRPYYNGLGDSFLITNAGFYLRDFNLVTDSIPIRIEEEIELSFLVGGILEKNTFQDDFVSISPASGTSYDLGTQRQREYIQQLSFMLGLPSDFENIAIDSIPSGHPLETDDNLLYDSLSGYASAFIEIVYDRIEEDTAFYHIPIASLNPVFTIDTSFLADYGEDIDIMLSVDLFEWTKGIDFAADWDNKTLIKSLFVENIPKSISLSQ